MCYRPIHITNNSLHYNSATMPFSFDAPCGHCEECARLKRTEWFVRSFYHWQHIKSLGGCGYFYTITYNDENLPNYQGVKCFSFSDVQLFLKRLKMRLHRLYHIKLTYLLTCEYGSLFQRPHYHVAFFVDKMLMPWTFYNQVNESWKKGFVYAGQNGGVIDSANALLYVTKYVTKDSSFQENDKLIEEMLAIDYARIYEEESKNEIDCPLTFWELRKNYLKWQDTSVYDFYLQFRREVSHRTTFNCHSTRLGYSILNGIDTSNMVNLKDDTILLPQNGEYQPVPLPRYISRYLYFDRVPNERDGKLNKFVLNVRGISHALYTLDSKIERKENQLKVFFQTQRLTDYQVQQLSTHFNFKGSKDFSFFMNNVDVDFHRMAIYSIVYRNRFCPKSFDFSMMWSNYKDIFRSFFEECEDRNLLPLSEYNVKQKLSIYTNLFNFKDSCYHYEQLLLLYEQVSHLISSESAEVLCVKRENQRKLKDIIKLSKIKVV